MWKGKKNILFLLLLNMQSLKPCALPPLTMRRSKQKMDEQIVDKYRETRHKMWISGSYANFYGVCLLKVMPYWIHYW